MIYSENYWQTQIHRIMPDLEIQDVDLFQEGLVNDVLIVNRKWVIRFTKTDYGKELMAMEAQLMRYLKPQIRMQLPYPVKHEDGMLVYELLSGEDFLRRDWLNANEGQQAVIAEQLGTFLRELHNVPVQTEGWEIPLTLAPVTRETWLDIYERLMEKVCPVLLPHQVQWLADLFGPALDQKDFFDFQPALIHGDLGPYHLLYEQQEQRLNGVIDFAMAGIGDPAADLGSLIGYYGETLISHLRPFYPRYDELLPRARFYAEAAEVHWVLLGVESGETYWFTAHLGEAKDIH
jgi:aminoglycoside 2''-phosphotransferase